MMLLMVDLVVMVMMVFMMVIMLICSFFETGTPSDIRLTKKARLSEYWASVGSVTVTSALGFYIDTGIPTWFLKLARQVLFQPCCLSRLVDAFTWHTNYHMSTSHFLHSLSSTYSFSFQATLNITLISFLKDLQSEFTSSSSVSSEILNLVFLEGISKPKISCTSFFHMTSLMSSALRWLLYGASWAFSVTLWVAFLYIIWQLTWHVGTELLKAHWKAPAAVVLRRNFLSAPLKETNMFLQSKTELSKDSGSEMNTETRFLGQNMHIILFRFPSSRSDLKVNIVDPLRWTI